MGHACVATIRWGRHMTDPAPIILYTTPNGAVRVEVMIRNETVWLSQKALAELFGVSVSSISRHLKNIYDTGELDRAATVAEIAKVRPEGDRSVQRATPSSPCRHERPPTLTSPHVASCPWSLPSASWWVWKLRCRQSANCCCDARKRHEVEKRAPGRLPTHPVSDQAARLDPIPSGAL